MKESIGETSYFRQVSKGYVTRSIRCPLLCHYLSNLTLKTSERFVGLTRYKLAVLRIFFYTESLLLVVDPFLHHDKLDNSDNGEDKH